MCYCHIKLDYKVLEPVSESTTKKKVYFDFLPISKRMCNDLQSLINNKILPYCRSSLYKDSNWNKNDFKSAALV